MKRTLRVEVIRYSRRSTLISNEAALERDLTAEQAAIDVLLGIPSTIESSVEAVTGADVEPAASHPETYQKPDRKGGLVSNRNPDVVQKRRPLRFLRKLVRG